LSEGERPEYGEPKHPDVFKELMEVHSCGTEDDVVHISLRTPKLVAV
jgi:hypothetical protein